ncbi:MAG: hypothetical protein IJ454_03365 [Clostridia bacterium]|nr:hypothetical protein [Clostridia bacterium]
MSKIRLWHHFKRFRFNSMLVRDFMTIFLFMLVISTATTQGFYHYYKKLTAEALSESNAGALGRVMDFVDLVSNEAESLAYRISTDSVVTDFLKTDLTDIEMSNRLEHIEKVRTVLNSAAFADDYLYSVDLYSLNNDYFVSQGTGCRISRSYMPVPDYVGKKNSWVSVVKNNMGKDLGLGFFQKICLPGSKEAAGIVVVVIDLDIFGQ